MLLEWLAQRYTEFTQKPPSLYCCARNILTVHRETLTQYITFKRGGEGSLYISTLYSCNCDVLHRRLCVDSDKIPGGGTSTYILHLCAAEAAFLATQQRIAIT